jgi:hypothetical protein
MEERGAENLAQISKLHFCTRCARKVQAQRLAPLMYRLSARHSALFAPPHSLIVGGGEDGMPSGRLTMKRVF